MSSSGDSLKIPIEIKTDDLDEIQKLINEISNAESELHQLKPRQGRGTDSSSRSAFARPEADTRGGIFGGQMDEARPGTPRDSKSKTPYQKESEFAQLRNQVQENTEKAGGADIFRGALGGATQAAGFGQFLGGGKGSLLGVAKIATKSFLPLAIITSIAEFVSSTLDALIAPGGKFDRRYKRNYKIESMNILSMKEKQEISFGQRVIRVTTIGSQRGTSSQVRSNLDYVKNGVDVFDVHGTLNKGIGAGTI